MILMKALKTDRTAYLEETPIFASMMELIKLRILKIVGEQQLVHVNNRDFSWSVSELERRILVGANISMGNRGQWAFG